MSTAAPPAPAPPPDGDTPRRRAIVAAAREILETAGAGGLTMRRLGEALGIRAPSLYKHFPDKAAVEAALLDAGFREAGAALTAAVAAAPEPVAAFAAAYRAFAREHPHLYRLMTGRPLPRTRLTPGVEQLAAAPLVRAVGGDLARARALWGLLHGLVLLELTDRFPPGADVDAAWAAGVAAFAGRPP